MKHLTIPNEYPDLQAYAREQIRHLWVKWGISVAAVLAVELLFLPYLEVTALTWVAVAVIWLAMSAIFFYIFDGFRLLRDPAFEGVVEHITCSTGRGMAIMPYRKLNRCPGEMNTQPIGRRLDGSPVFGRRMRGNLPDVEKVMKEGTACVMTVRTDAGEMAECAVVFFDVEDVPVRVGDRVIKYRGLQYPVVLNRKNYICAVCGRTNEGDLDGTCSVCGHTLIK